MSNNNDRQVIIAGTKWITVSTVTDAVVQILRLGILARFLTKEDFGVVAICTMVLGLTQVFADLGFSVGLMSRKNVTGKEFSSVFWVQFILFAVLFFVLSLSAPLIANFYGEESLKILIPVSLLSLPFWGVGKLYDTVIHKDMQYKTMGVRSIIASISSLVFAYIFCILDFGIYSLILSSLLFAVIVNLWNLIAGQKQYKLKLHLNFYEVVPYFKIGVYSMGTRILDYMSSQIDVMIIGKALDMQTLGVYNLAKSLVIRLYGILTSINSKITLPILAKNNDDVDNLKRLYGKVVNITAFICTPALVMLLIFAKDTLTIMYGNQYEEATLLLQIFCIIFILNSIVSTEGILTSATGQTRLDFIWTVVRVILTLGVVWYTSKMSVEAIALGQLIVTLVGFVFIWRYIVYPITKLTFKDFTRFYWREIIAGFIVVMLLGYFIGYNVFAIDNIVSRLIVYVPLFAIAYIGVLYIADKKVLNDILGLLKKN